MELTPALVESLGFDPNTLTSSSETYMGMSTFHWSHHNLGFWWLFQLILHVQWCRYPWPIVAVNILKMEERQCMFA